MGSTVIARVLLAAAALAVAGGLLSLERAHDRCQDAVRGAFLASAAPDAELAARADEAIDRCSAAEPLTRLALGLRVERPAVAAHLARAATERSPESYVAWGILAVAAPPSEAQAAAERARELNPLSVAAGS